VEVQGNQVTTDVPPPEPYQILIDHAKEVDQLVTNANTGKFDRERAFIWGANIGGALIAPPDAPPDDADVKTFQGTYRINGAYFSDPFGDSMTPLAMPMLDTTEVWTIKNESGKRDPNLPVDLPLLEWHPFHIHQNDFSVLEINGVPVKDLKQAYLKGVLSDTIGIPLRHAEN
jgi:FtsP/CotA-like multicopper oxidase with cupredoxin domain